MTIRSSYRRRLQLWSLVFLAPALILFVVMTLIPVAQAVIMAFYSYDPFRGNSIVRPQFVGLDNFATVLRSAGFWQAMKNTLLFSLGVVPLSTALTLTFALLMQPLRRAYQHAFKAAFYLPGVVSDAVIALIWFWIFNPTFGLLNYFLSLLGFGPIYWLADETWALPSIMLMAVVSGWGVSVIIFSAAIDQIPESLYEAAAIEGAGSWRQFRHITWPLMRPAFLFVLVIGTLSSLQVFTPI
ncbi:MAG: sugar ABC transporter permease [candidate division KSB1 bacterium]|nr:sugar ABC transporter permease [candidate division KSB1 bacterium]